MLILAAVAWNLVAAARSDATVLQHPAYLALIGVILLSGMASVAVRIPAAWHEWRSPRPIAGRHARSARLDLSGELDAEGCRRLAAAARAGGFRVSEHRERGRWSLDGTRRGWSRLAGLGSHAALVALVVAAAASGATTRESTFSLLPGEQALLDSPRVGFTDAVRLDSFEAEFGPDGRPVRLDTVVTFLRDGAPVSAETLQVNHPGAFGGYLVHGWTYGPAAQLRITTLAGRALLDAAVPLDEERGDVPVGGIWLSALEAGIGLALVDPTANLVAVTLLGSDGAVHTAHLRPGGEERIGPIIVRLDALDAYVTFLSRRDPMLPFVVGSATLLVLTLALGFWLPRRRLTIRQEAGRVVVLMRGERFADPDREMQAMIRRLREALA